MTFRLDLIIKSLDSMYTFDSLVSSLVYQGDKKFLVDVHASELKISQEKFEISREF